ncbi:MAG: type III polyketide synthase, partial [Bacteroidota bacterium]|nr:type III polyketide synthase [Bacteroidota bacterium]
MGKAFLLSIGTSVPKNKVSQDHYFESLIENSSDTRQKRIMKVVKEQSRISHRYSVLPDYSSLNNNSGIFSKGHSKKKIPRIGKRMEIFEANALNLSLDAVNDAFKSVPNLEKSTISHIITFSCTGMFAPGIDMGIIERFDLDKSIERTCINFMGCYAAIIALKSAYHIIRSQPEAVVLLVGVEICSLHYLESQEPEQIVANAIFGDGAAAVILSSEQQLKQGGTMSFQIENFYSLFSPASKKEMTWKIGDHAFELFLSSYIPKLLNHELGT